MRPFRFGTAIATATVCLAMLSSTADALPTSVVCPPALNAVAGTGGDDTLGGSDAADCLVGDDGADRIRAGAGDDVIDPGPGIDRASGGGGDDTFEIRSACEVGRGEVINGGAGVDVVRGPLTRAQLEGLGVRLRSIEQVDVVPSAFPGACVATEVGTLCTCCDRDGFDPEAACRGCLPGTRLDDPVVRSGDVVDVGYDEARCVVDPSCASTDCGPRGHCFDTGTGATCVCDPGYAGSACEACAPPYERTADGRCILGPACARERCGGHGLCVPGERAGGIRCRCDSGWNGDPQCRGDDTAIGGPGFVAVGGSPQVFGLSLRNGAHCTTRFKWKRSSGRGRLRVDRDDTRVAIYTPPSRLRGRVEHVRLQAVCTNNASVAATRDIVVGTPPNAGDDDGIKGECDERVAGPFDEAVLDYMADNQLEGATLAITYQEQVVCLRAYGSKGRNRATGGDESMTTCTPMRVASVTKPFTRALFRGNLFGQAIPAGLGTGSVGEDTPLLPILAGTMGLGPSGEVGWQAPAGIYDASYPPFIMPSLGLEPCSSSDGVINSAWAGITINATLGHTAGFPPNHTYAFSPTDDDCTGAMGEVCGGMAGVGDPTVSASTVTRIPNDLKLDHGVVTVDDMVRWMAGICLYDSWTQGRYRYSNVGFTIAGKVIEALTGQPYEDYLVDILSGDGITNIAAPGSPVVYLGQSKGGGPRTYALASWMTESDYFTPRGDTTDVTAAVPPLPFINPFWSFPFSAPAPYGGTNFDVMAPHGGLAMNALALAKFGSEYLIEDGTPRDAARGGPGLNVYYPNDFGVSHNGLLYGTWALTWELPTGEPANKNNPNGKGCLVPGDKTDADDPVKNNGLNALDVDPCPLPQGIRISVIFNSEPPLPGTPAFIRGRHDLGLLTHVVRRAASQVGTTAAEWGALVPLTDQDLRIGCDLKCPAMGDCVNVNCGNGVLEPDLGEECDDGDNDFGDTCLPDCTIIDPEPPGYADCAGEDPGTCLGGPCAPREEMFVSQSDLLDPYSTAHPDGDFSRHHFCHDSFTAGLPWEEATCVRTVILDEPWGVCRECGVETMVGCTCPAPNQEDGGCNENGFNGYSCVGGRCWQGLPPSWMCTADCDDDIYGTGGYCFHDDAKGAVCYNDFCDEPVATWCAQEFGAVCDVNVDGCLNDTCCTPECLDDQDCDALGYSPGHTCVQERCTL